MTVPEPPVIDDMIGPRIAPPAAVRHPMVLAGLVVAAVGLVAVSAVLSTVFAFLMVFHCGGDGGVPYAATDSAYGRFCDSQALEPYFYLAWLAPPITALVAGALAVLRRSLKAFAVAMAVVFATLVILVGIPAALPDECSQEQIEAGARCATY